MSNTLVTAAIVIVAVLIILLVIRAGRDRRAAETVRPGLRGTRIALISHHPMTLTRLQLFAKKSGMSAQVVGGTAEALTVIAPTDYDVAVVRLADVDGARAVPALLTCRIPTVLLVSSFRGNLPDQVANRPTIAVVVEPWHHTEITLAIAHARGIQRRATT